MLICVRTCKGGVLSTVLQWLCMPDPHNVKKRANPSLSGHLLCSPEKGIDDREADLLPIAPEPVGGNWKITHLKRPQNEENLMLIDRSLKHIVLIAVQRLQREQKRPFSLSLLITNQWCEIL